MNKQIRIYVNGRFQFSLTVAQDERHAEVANRARAAMRLSDTLVPKHAPGLINFVAGA